MRANLFCFIAVGLSLSLVGLAFSPAITGIIHRYSICSSSEEDIDTSVTNVSYFHIVMRSGEKFPTYIYHIGNTKHIEGRVLDFMEKAYGCEYVLEHFFGQSNARLSLYNIGDADNIKYAMIYYAQEEEDTIGVCWQNILIDEDYNQPFI